MSQIIIVTGASSGLGLSLAKRFLQNGDMVIGVSKTRKNWPKALKVLGNHKNLTLRAADLAREANVRKLIAFTAKKFKHLDCLINSAGYGGTLSRVEKTPLLEFQRHIEQNLHSSFLACKYAVPIMRKQDKGFIVNISSMAGKRAVPRLAAYSASKFGIVALSQCVAKENTDTGLKCITVCPGGMNTQMRAKIFGSEDAGKQQSTDFVADVIFDVVQGKIDVESGGDIVVRHGKITAINPAPAA